MKDIKKSNNIATSAFLVTAMMLSFKILGFIKQAVIAYYFGANGDTDIYFVAYGFVSGISEIIINSLRVSIIVVYTSIIINKGKKYANGFVSILLEIFIPLSIIIIGIIIILAPNLASLLAPYYSYEQKNILINYVIALGPIISLSIIELIMGAILDADKSFFFSISQSFIYSVSIIVVSITLSSCLGIKSLVLGQYISSVLFCLLLIGVVCYKYEFRFTFITKIREYHEIKNVLNTAAPLFIGNGVLQINQIIDKSITTGLSAGAASSLMYCHTLEQFVTNIMIVNIGNVLFSHFSTAVAEKRFDNVKSILKNAINSMIIILLPVSVITILCSNDIVRIVYFRGGFTEAAVNMTSIALIGYSIFFPCVAIRDLTIKSNYAFSDTKGPMVASIISIICNIFLSISLSKIIGILGITLATGISVIVGMGLNILCFKKHMPNYDFINHFKLCFKLLPCTFPILIGDYVLSFISVNNPYIRFFTISIIGFIIYILLGYLFKVELIEKMISKIIERCRRVICR